MVQPNVKKNDRNTPKRRKSRERKNDGKNYYNSYFALDYVFDVRVHAKYWIEIAEERERERCTECKQIKYQVKKRITKHNTSLHHKRSEIVNACEIQNATNASARADTIQF